MHDAAVWCQSHIYENAAAVDAVDIYENAAAVDAVAEDGLTRCCARQTSAKRRRTCSPSAERIDAASGEVAPCLVLHREGAIVQGSSEG